MCSFWDWLVNSFKIYNSFSGDGFRFCVSLWRAFNIGYRLIGCHAFARKISPEIRGRSNILFNEHLTYNHGQCCCGSLHLPAAALRKRFKSDLNEYMAVLFAVVTSNWNFVSYIILEPLKSKYPSDKSILFRQNSILKPHCYATRKPAIYISMRKCFLLLKKHIE